MTQRELEAAVAQVTGENIREIRRRGFSVADPLNAHFDPEPDNLPPSFLDWDDHELNYRNVPLFAQPVCDLQRAG